MKHPHAELMLEYAKDAMETDKPWERWEMSYGADTWYTVDEDDVLWHKYRKYRRKPEPEEVLPPAGTPVWVRDSELEPWTIGMFVEKEKSDCAYYAYWVQHTTHPDEQDYYKYMTTENPYKPAV